MWEQFESVVNPLDVLDQESEVVADPQGLFLKFLPFPYEQLPRACSEYVRQTAEAVGFDPSFVALPLISSLSAAIGNSVRVRVNSEWTEPLVFWTAIVADSGSKKSTAINKGTYFTDQRERKEFEYYEQAWQVFQSELEDWKMSKCKDGKPHEPRPKRLAVNDTTMEALLQILSENSKGLLAKYDELSGFFGGMNQYKQRGTDKANWLGMFRAEKIVIDRKSSGTLRVPRAFVSLTGAIQPEILKDSLTKENLESGLASRFLFTWPPERMGRWSDGQVSLEVIEQMEFLFHELFNLSDGAGNGVEIALTNQAKLYSRHFCDELGREIYSEDRAAIKAALAKMEGYFFRLAGLLSIVENLESFQRFDTPISLEHCERAGTLIEWFKRESIRLYRNLSGDTSDNWELIELIAMQPEGRITARELAHKKSRYRKAGTAEAALMELKRKGFLTCETSEPSRSGGRPQSFYRLIERLQQ